MVPSRWWPSTRDSKICGGSPLAPVPLGPVRISPSSFPTVSSGWHQGHDVCAVALTIAKFEPGIYDVVESFAPPRDEI
jgi:hypothetical protein